MEQSILKSTKKMLQIGPDDDSFDLDILTHINSAFSTLTDIGVGPDGGFAIVDATAEWDSFLEDDLIQLNQVKTFVYLHARLVFDPPTTSFVQSSIEKQIEEVTWRLNARREAREWTDPDPRPAEVVEFIDVDGGIV
jgi:hypothetical protein